MPLGGHHSEPASLDNGSFRKSRFLTEDSTGTLTNVSLVARLAAFLVPCFLILDYFVYPDLFGKFLVLRLVCTAIILFIWVLCRSHWARRCYRVFAVLVPLVCAIFITAMIYQIGDPGTPYYGGLMLCIIAVGALCHWNYREAIFTSVAVLGMYLAVTLPKVGSLEPGQLGLFINNCLFLSATGLIVIVGSWANHGLRVKEFISRAMSREQRAELKEKNVELQSTLTALEETESQLIQSEKMAFIGQVSAGVIHEIGNPLNFANQALFLLRKKAKKTEQAESMGETIADIQEGMDRIKEIVSGMREFSHTGTSGGELFDLSEPVDGALRILRPEIEKYDARIELNFCEATQVQGSRNQIQQVATNLIHNALQAVGELEKQPELVISTQSAPGRGGSFTVQDNGPGISKDIQTHLFDPFFTTKDPGKGTGLGLSICYRIIESHGGTIEVQSEPGDTRFTVFLPSEFSAEISATQPLHAV